MLTDGQAYPVNKWVHHSEHWQRVHSSRKYQYLLEAFWERGGKDDKRSGEGIEKSEHAESSVDVITWVRGSAKSLKNRTEPDFGNTNQTITMPYIMYHSCNVP